jgi:hypothetical protein
MSGADVATLTNATGTEIVIGKPYLTYYVIRFPSWPGYAFLNTFVFKFLVNVSKQTATIRVDSGGFVDPDALAAADVAGTLPFKVPADFKVGKGKPWAVFVQWRKVAEGQGGASESGIESVAKLIAAIALAGLGYLTFRSFTNLTTETVGSKGPLQNPGLVIAALAAIALIMVKR